VRARGGADLGVMPLSDFAGRLKLDVEQRQNVASAGWFFELYEREISLKNVRTGSTVKSVLQKYD